MLPFTTSRNRSRFGVLAGAPLLAALLLNGCLAPADPDPASPAAETPAGALDPAKGLAALEAMGYPRDQIEPVEGGFVVQRDMVFRLPDLVDAQGAPLAKTAQRQSTPVSSPPPQRILVAMHASMKSDWLPIVSQAVNNWNALNTRLHLVFVQGNSGNIVIYADSSSACPAALRNLPGSVLGRAFAAAGGSPGSALSINTDLPGFGDTRFRVQVVTHELGHTIGLHHTNGTSGTHIPGTPVTDNLSLMNDGGNSTNVLSAEDIKALEIMYPSDKPLGGTDLDGDFLDDIVVWRPATGSWRILTSSSGFTTGLFTTWGQRGDFPLADMDVNGDGHDDKVVWRQGDLRWHILHSQVNTTRSLLHGQAGDIPIAGHDLDGDQKEDLVLWRWKEARFLWLSSLTNYVSGGSFAWGAIGDRPVGGIDADQDGKDDLVVWRPSDNRFHVAFSSTGFTTSDSYQRGTISDIPMGGNDLDRDGKDDLAVFTAGAAWSALLSSGDFLTQRILSTGHSGAVPLLGTDIDQDGLRDLVVWNPTGATWVVKKSSTDFATTVNFIWGQ